MTGTATRPAREQHRLSPVPRWLATVMFHRYRWAGMAVTAAVGMLAGWLTGVLMPRGPITPVGVVVAMTVGFAVGGSGRLRAQVSVGHPGRPADLCGCVRDHPNQRGRPVGRPAGLLHRSGLLHAGPRPGLPRGVPAVAH